MKALSDVKPQVIVKFALFGALLAGIYYSTYSWLITIDWVRGDYSHCYLIPFVVFYLLWEKRQQLVSITSTPSWKGMVIFGLGIVLFWLGELGGEFFTIYISSWLVIVGLCWMHLGWQKLKTIGFALLMILAMFPFPGLVSNQLTLTLKLISSQIGVWMLHLYGMSAYREGNIIDLGFTQLQVVDACSGLRYLFPLLVMGILLAYFYRAAMWKRLVLVLSTIPLTIVINSLRIALTGIIYAHWGAAVAEGFFHGFSGWLIFVSSLFILLAEMKVLSFREKVLGKSGWFRIPEGEMPHKTSDFRHQTSDLKPGTSDSRHQTSDLKRKTSNFKLKTIFLSFFTPSQFVVALVLLVLTLSISMGVEFREKIPASRPFSQFPLTVGAWEGTRQYMEQVFIKELDLSDYAMIDFKSDGKHVDFYVAYYESQRKGESIHSPETCLPGSGWVFRQAGRAFVSLLESGRSITVNRAIIEKSGYRQLSYFWFPARGRILTNAWEMKIYAFWDALIRQRTDGALVRLITPVLQGEQVEDAEARLQGFTREIVPVLDGFIPK